MLINGPDNFAQKAGQNNTYGKRERERRESTYSFPPDQSALLTQLHRGWFPMASLFPVLQGPDSNRSFMYFRVQFGHARILIVILVKASCGPDFPPIFFKFPMFTLPQKESGKRSLAKKWRISDRRIRKSDQKVAEKNRKNDRTPFAGLHMRHPEMFS